MEIISSTINKIATSQISEGVINTYTYSQDVEQPVVEVRVEISKNGAKVAVANYMGSSNRLLVDMSDYKFLTLQERQSALSTMLEDLQTILSEK